MQPSPKALDGGWAWAIAAASFAAQLLAYGSPQSVGVLYPEWLQAFRQGKGATAWVGSLVAGVGLVAGPVCSACVDNFGARPVTVFSGVMVAGGLMLSAFAPNVQFLIFSYGTVVGLGCGLVYAATLTITCQYFEKRRGLALGIVTTGTSFGSFIYATSQNELIVMYGLDGCLLIIGAVSLNLMACAGFMRPLNRPGYYLKQKAALERSAEEQLFEKHALEEPKASAGSSSTSSTSSTSPPGQRPVTKELLLAAEAKDCVRAEAGRGGLLAPVLSALRRKRQAYSQYSQSTYEILQNQAMAAFCVAIFLFSLGAFPPVLFIEDVAQSQGLVEEVSVIPLVSIGAVATCAGKLVLGVLVDVRWINSIYLYAFTMFAGGAALLLIPATKSYLGLQVLSAVLGFFSGNWSLTSYITTKMVGLERLTQAHGALMFFGGLGIILGPPVVGWFFDWTQSYDLAFYFSGSCVLLGAFLLSGLTLPCRTRGSAGGGRPDIHYTSSCEQVASVA